MSITTLTATATNHTFHSADGSTIAYLTQGLGPAIILIPGALSTADDYAAFANALGKHFTVHTIERRGRGLSAPQGPAYNLGKEIADVNALQAITGATMLVGHSFGGLVALETARHNSSIRKVAVYEPGVSIDGSINMSWLPAYERYLTQGRQLDAFTCFSLGLGPDAIRNASHWLTRLMLPLFVKKAKLQKMLTLLAENGREHREVGRYDNSYRRYGEITASVLHMTGGKTGSRWVEIQAEHLGAVIPGFQTHQFPALDHFGIDQKGPQEVAAYVATFLQE
jgi:pimeloyl-ACP methyl ester carboxylesterase